jgi:ribosome-associated translation inhibitor RaiA
MHIPLDLTFRDMDSSAAVTEAVQRLVDRLAKFDHRIQRCAVVVERPHQHHRSGQQFHVRIELTVPDRTITVARDAGLDASHEDIYIAIADAFRAAKRQLQDHAQIQRGDVKTHV